ncbi:MAG: hypothetical protein LDL51_06495 [Chloroflexi bacterium]|nr:hypothetical protein [Chloroflexota bacterium]
MWAFLLFGIIAAFLGCWVWTSLALGFLIFVLMAAFGSTHYGAARKAAGLRYNVKGKRYPPEPVKSDEEVFASIAKENPVLLTVVGCGGFILIAWLMTAKPF